jgi:hypothetical protein
LGEILAQGFYGELLRLSPWGSIRRDRLVPNATFSSQIPRADPLQAAIAPPNPDGITPKNPLPQWGEGNSAIHWELRGIKRSVTTI